MKRSSIRERSTLILGDCVINSAKRLTRLKLFVALATGYWGIPKACVSEELSDKTLQQPFASDCPIKPSRQLERITLSKNAKLFHKRNPQVVKLSRANARFLRSAMRESAYIRNRKDGTRRKGRAFRSSPIWQA